MNEIIEFFKSLTTTFTNCQLCLSYAHTIHVSMLSNTQFVSEPSLQSIDNYNDNVQVSVWGSLYNGSEWHFPARMHAMGSFPFIS